MTTQTETRSTVGYLLLLGLMALMALLGCATGPTPVGIAKDLDRALTFQAALPLAVRCQTVKDIAARCERAGFPSECAWDGWNDRDADHFSIAACTRREP